jgi:hypothetical protein
MADTAVVYQDGTSVRSVTYTGAANTMGTNIAPGTVIVSTEAMTITLANAADVQYPIGTQIFIVNDGDHITTLTNGTGNTLDGDLAGPAFAGSTHVLTLVAADTWVTGQVTGA